MDELTGLDALLVQIVAPWDAQSWDNLREDHRATADALAAAVAQGLTEQQMRDFCARLGYPPWASNWLAQAIKHLNRVAAETAEAETAAEPTAAPEAQPLPSRQPIVDAPTRRRRGELRAIMDGALEPGA